MIRVTDAEAVGMSRYLVQHDGLFLGSSSACNLVACVRLAKAIGRGSGRTLVTILCDSGSRHYSKVRRPLSYCAMGGMTYFDFIHAWMEHFVDSFGKFDSEDNCIPVFDPHSF